MNPCRSSFATGYLYHNPEAFFSLERCVVFLQEQLTVARTLPVARFQNQDLNHAGHRCTSRPSNSTVMLFLLLVGLLLLAAAQSALYPPKH